MEVESKEAGNPSCSVADSEDLVAGLRSEEKLCRDAVSGEQ